MDVTGKEDNLLRLKFIGIDSWDRPVYKDQHGQLWKDASLGSLRPHLYSASGNDFEGEPNEPIGKKFTILQNQGAGKGQV